MIGRLSDGPAPVRAALDAWITERSPHIAGFIDAGLMLTDDGRGVITFARFADRDAYAALADDPAQDEWYRTRLAPALDGDPQWFDGEWLAPPELPAR